MEHPKFGVRFGYALWLHHLRTGRALQWSKIGAAIGRSGQAVSAWPDAEEAPTDWRIQQPLAELLEVSSDWLIKNDGTPPLPELYSFWEAARNPAKPMTGFKKAGAPAVARRKSS